MRAVVVERQRIGDAAAREGQPRLPRRGSGISSGAPERSAVRGRRSGSRRRTSAAHRPASPARRRRGLAASRPRPSARANRAPRDPLRTISASMPRSASSLLDRRGDLFGAERQRAGIAGNVDARLMRAPPRRSRRACLVEPADHLAVQHRRRARRRKGRGNRPVPASPAVAWSFRGSRCRACLSACGDARREPIDWQASARQSFSTCRPAGWLR